MTVSGKISVVLPCYNAGPYIREAMESILQQTYQDLELIVINDGSRDNSLEVIQTVAATDPRVRVISRENRGLINTLNEGIAVARGEYIARMDADDISLPERFSKQLDYLVHNRLDLVGGAIQRFFPQSDRPDKVKFYPETHDELVACLLTMKSRIAHPAVLARKEIFSCHRYDLKYKYAEDYALWLQIALDGRFRLGNLPEVVLRYRSHEAQVTSTNRRENKAAKRQAFLDAMAPLVGANTSLLEPVYNLWQSKSWWRRCRGALWLRRWFACLQTLPCYNPRVRNYLVARMWEQLL